MQIYEFGKNCTSSSHRSYYGIVNANRQLDVTYEGKTVSFYCETISFKFGVRDGPSVRDEYKVCITPVHFNDPIIHRECIPWCFSGIIHVLYQNTVVCNRKIRDIGNYFTISTVFYTCILYNTSWCTCNWSCMFVSVKCKHKSPLFNFLLSFIDIIKWVDMAGTLVMKFLNCTQEHTCT